MIFRLKKIFSSDKHGANPDDPNAHSDKPPTHAASTEQSIIHKEQGDVHLRAGSLDEAKACYQDAIAINPNFAKAYSNLGYIFSEQRNFKEAEHYLRTALAIDSQNADTHYMLGTILQVHGNPKDAILHFQKALEIDPELLFAYRDLCLLLFQLGEIESAKEVVTRGISYDPSFPYFHYYLGNLYAHARELDKAVSCYTAALSIHPDFVEVHFNLGIALQDQGKLSDAVLNYQKAISLKPDFTEAHFNLGVVLFRDMHLLSEAEASFRNVLKCNPNHAEAHYNLGNILRASKRLAEAEVCYRQAIKIKPDHADAHLNLGNLFLDISRLNEAEGCYRQVLNLIPQSAETLSNLGNVLKEMGRLADAEACFRRALDVNPEFAQVHSNLALTLRNMGRLVEAEASCRRAIQINPEFADAHINLGAVLQDMGRFVEAEGCYRRALQIRPHDAVIHRNLGSVLKEIGRFTEAEASFRKALQINPAYVEAHSSLIFTMDLMDDKDVASLQEERKIWDAAHAAILYQSWAHTNKPDPGRRLRIGYVSADFREHSAPRVFGGMLTSYDRSQFDVFAYSNFSGKDDRFSNHFKQNVTVWRNIVGLSDEAVSSLIRDDQIDILVDLSGHSSNNRLMVFARKPAPIQITAWGYATSTGMRAMDVFFADPVLVPPSDTKYFTEEVRYLPCVVGSFSLDSYPDLNELPALSNGVVTFGSLNRLVKVSDNAYQAWAAILLAVPQSRLFLKTPELDDASNRERVIEHFSNAGVAADRIIMKGRTSWNEHLRAFHQFDLALDPFPHGGGVTTLESYMMGVPVITLRWPTMVGSVSASIITALGQQDWIANSSKEYVELAIQKASDVKSLAELRRQLRGIFTSSLVGNQTAYTQAVEKEYRKLWQEWCSRQ